MFGLAEVPDAEVELTVLPRPPPAPEPSAVADGSVPDVDDGPGADEFTPGVDTDDETAPTPEDVHPTAAATTTANREPANKNPRLRMHPR